jgi:HEAT repeats
VAATRTGPGVMAAILLTMAACLCFAQQPTEPEVPPDELQNMIKALRYEEPEIRAAAAVALGNLGQSAGPAVPALSAALDDSDCDVRSQVLLALGRIGRPARFAVPRLIKVLKETDADLPPTLPGRIPCAGKTLRIFSVFALGSILTDGGSPAPAAPRVRGSQLEASGRAGAGVHRL